MDDPCDPAGRGFWYPESLQRLQDERRARARAAEAASRCWARLAAVAVVVAVVAALMAW